MRECLDEAILQSYFDGELSGQQLESVTSHLAACSTCAETARGIEAETALLAAAFAPEFEAAVPTEQLRRRIDAAIAGLQTPSVPVNESSASSVRGWLQSLFAPLSFTPQRAFGYAGLVLVLGFAAILGIMQWRTATPDNRSVASRETTPGFRGNIGSVATPSPANSPAAPAASPVKSAPTSTSPRNTAPRRYANPSNVGETVAKATPKADDKVKLLPGERSYLQTIAKLDSTIKSNSRPMRPALQAEYQRNLALVDRALATTRDAAKKNPNDPDAAEFMMAAYQNKVNLLNAVAEARTFNRQQD
ncbi:MAG TPA: zf-HC2 domain-containing protein [Pyrinomonadaceae bacterium]|nr:zf-HC2 domain-containing protein [Pyrinomonadaceae bacterium]